MERVERHCNETYVYYKSWDGEVFKTEEACIEHENKPIVRAWKGVQKCLVRKTYGFSLFSPLNLGEEYEAYIFKPESHEDIEALNCYVSTDPYGNTYKSHNMDDSYIGKYVIIYDPFTRQPWLLDDMLKELKENVESIIESDEADSDYDEEEKKIVRNIK